jgi:hypothetical protein
MQERQLRLGDILDDYCPRERRVTNHAVVAMVGDEVKQTRCTTCDADHEYKQAKVPRQRRKKNDAPAALYAQVAAGAPKRVAAAPVNSDPLNDRQVTDESPGDVHEAVLTAESTDSKEQAIDQAERDHDDTDKDSHEDAEHDEAARDEGPVHRPLIRASLPRPEGQQPPARPIPEFTIRQPGGGRPGRFRPRHQRGGQGQQFQGNRSNGNMGGPNRGARPGGGRPGMKRHGHKRSK